MAVIAPFRYSALLFSAVAGYAIWGEVPDVAAACAGIDLAIEAAPERLELKQEQIHAFGPDPRMANSRGSMRARVRSNQRTSRCHTFLRRRNRVRTTSGRRRRD